MIDRDSEIISTGQQWRKHLPNVTILEHAIVSRDSICIRNRNNIITPTFLFFIADVCLNLKFLENVWIIDCPVNIKGHSIVLMYNFRLLCNGNLCQTFLFINRRFFVRDAYPIKTFLRILLL